MERAAIDLAGAAIDGAERRDPEIAEHGELRGGRSIAKRNCALGEYIVVFQEKALSSTTSAGE